MDPSDIRLFALNASRSFGEAVAQKLGLALAEHAEKEFDDGECKCRPLGGVRGKDVFVIHSLHRDAAHSQNDKLMRLLLLLGAAADAGAASVTAVVPYLCYARQDRKAEPNDPVTTRYLARMFEAVGTSRVVALDVHNLAAFQNAFRLATEHIEAASLFAAHFAALLAGAEVVVVSPDAGGVRRAERLRRALSEAMGKPIANAFVEKQRNDGVVGGQAAFGDFAGRAAVVVDDMICTGGTIVRAAHICRRLGASRVYAAATHAAFAGQAARALADPALEGVVVTNSIPVPAPDAGSLRLTVLDAAELVATSIREIHAGGNSSLSALPNKLE